MRSSADAPSIEQRSEADSTGATLGTARAASDRGDTDRDVGQRRDLKGTRHADVGDEIKARRERADNGACRVDGVKSPIRLPMPVSLTSADRITIGSVAPISVVGTIKQRKGAGKPRGREKQRATRAGRAAARPKAA